MFKKEAVHERREFNNGLYEKIFNITGKPRKILDIGCGLNPLYFPYNDIYYIAVDIDKEALKQVKKHFRKNRIKGKVIYLDINEVDKLKELDKVDLVFVFKILDDIDKKIVKDVIKHVKTKYFITSFATRTISGKRMNKPKRKWFEKMFKIHGKVRFYNEIFYVIKK